MTDSSEARKARLDRMAAALCSDDRRDWDAALAQAKAGSESGYIAVPARLILRISDLAEPLNEREALANELDGTANQLATHYTTFPWGTVRRAAELLRESARKAD